MTRVRIRGIYATALTHRLRDEMTIVQASPPIDRRFDEAFPVTAQDVTVDTTNDRQGIGVIGPPAAVTAVIERIAGIGRDTLVWEDPAPRSASFTATVLETLGSGAVVDLGPKDGFLPYDEVDGYVEEGDTLRVQVQEPTPPWEDQRPVVSPTLKVYGGLVELHEGATGPKAHVAADDRARELVRTTEMLPTTVPDEWGVRWTQAAGDASMDALDSALESAVDRATAIADEPSEAAPPEATEWVWFGRESRFTLDTDRREVVTTMAGHHRIKAGSEEASTAVDFAERLCEPRDEFPFDAVAELFGPAEGDRIAIEHGKPDGRRFALGSGEVVDRDGEEITVRREMTAGGEYDALAIPRESGDTATTKLKEGRWWYPTTYSDVEGAVKGTYVNICTPVELFPAAAAYLDLEVDVIRHADGSVERVDDDELDAAVAAGHVPVALAEKARAVASAVERALGD